MLDMEIGIFGYDNFKRLSGIARVDPSRLREDVRILHEKYDNQFSYFGLGAFPFFGQKECVDERKYYVYEWFTKDKGKIFYVGKGSGKRYNHIISEIKENRGNRRYSRYLELQQNFGIEYRIVADKLTNIEAVIYEKCWILEMIAQGEVLLQHVDIPRKVDRANAESFLTRRFEPIIISGDYRRRYFGVTEVADFDVIKIELLRETTFLNSAYDRFAYQEKIAIRDYVRSCGGVVYPVATNDVVKSAIEFGILDFDEYIDLKKKGYAIFHSFHVIDFIKTTAPVAAEGRKPWTSCELFFNRDMRDAMRAYLKEIASEIYKIADNASDDHQLFTKGLECANRNAVKEAIMFLEAGVRMKSKKPAMYLELAMIYRGLGMFNEEVGILEQGLAVVRSTNNSICKLEDRLYSAKPFLRWK